MSQRGAIEQATKKRCIPATHYCEVRQIAIDRMGKPHRPGYRLCKNSDCIEVTHITQSRYLAQRVYSNLPKLYRQNKVRPANPLELHSVAEKTNKPAAKKTCGIYDCKRPNKNLNLCKAHYMQFYKFRKQQQKSLVPDHSDINKYILPPLGNMLQIKDRHCHYPECAEPYFARGLCKMHHTRWLRWKNTQNV